MPCCKALKGFKKIPFSNMIKYIIAFENAGGGMFSELPTVQ
jgi:hypothetical protein